jgi:lysyl-tRNA synthetase class 1
MLWVDKVVEDIKREYAEEIAAGGMIIVRDEKTASGRVHVGSMRGVAIHATVTEALRAAGINVLFLYEINDFDVMDGLPVYLDAAVYTPEMGKILKEVPSPDPSAPNYAEYFGQEFEKVILDTGYEPSFYRASSLYTGGQMNDVIFTALNNAALIRDIYKEVSGSVKPDDWYPISIVCENCGRVGTTRAHGWDGKEVTYTCEPAMVKWAVGCGHTGKTTPYDGRAKFPWKVEWAAKWRVMNVAVEGAGKDHSTKGGSREVAERISREVFNYEPPYDIPYEFFLVGGAKMSSSKGRGASARDVADLMPPVIFRLLTVGTQPMRAINIDPEGETLPTLFDWYDEIADKYWNEIRDDDARLFEVIHHGKPLVKHFLARFSSVAFLVQMPHVDMQAEFGKLKGAPLTLDEIGALEERVRYAQNWLKDYAPERYKFEVQKELPEGAKALESLQKKALLEIVTFLEANPSVSGELLHIELHEIRKRLEIEPKAYFSAIYLSILGKESGPQAGWFLTTLDRDFLITRFKEVSA